MLSRTCAADCVVSAEGREIGDESIAEEARPSELMAFFVVTPYPV